MSKTLEDFSAAGRLVRNDWSHLVEAAMAGRKAVEAIAAGDTIAAQTLLSVMVAKIEHAKRSAEESAA